MSEQVYVFTWRHAVQKADLEPLTKLVLYNLCNYMNTQGKGCYPTTLQQAADTCLSEPTVCKYLEKACAAGFIVKVSAEKGGQGWSNNAYEARYPDNYTVIAPIAGKGKALNGVKCLSPEQTADALNGIKCLDSNNQQKGTKPRTQKALNGVKSNSSYNSPPQPELYWEGVIVKLNKEQYQTLRAITRLDMSKFEEVLQARDRELADNPAKQKGWYNRTINYFRAIYEKEGEHANA